MIVEMEDYAWSEHIVTVFLACQERTSPTYSQRKNNPRQLHRSGNSSHKNGLGVLCEAWRGVLQNFTINAVDILVIDLYALHIRRYIYTFIFLNFYIDIILFLQYIHCDQS
jgi:hypothetical protein